MLGLVLTLQKYLDIDKNEKPGWYYLGKYVFNGRESDGRIEINVDGLNPHTNLLFYSDANTDWKAVWDKRSDCAAVSSTQLTTRVITESPMTLTIAKTPAPSYWYVAVSNCEAKFVVNGTIHLEDLEWGAPARSYNTEFDFSEQDEMEVTSAFALLFGCMFMQQVYNFFMRMKPKRHMFVGLVTVSTGLLALGYLIRMLWCARYAQTGRSYWMNAASDIVILAGDILMVLICLFIGQGYLISHPVLQHKLITWILYGVTAALALATELYWVCTPDNAMYAYDLETIPGLLYIVARTACAFFFLFAILNNRAKETYKERKALYTVLCIIFACELFGPLVAFLFNLCYPRWFRATFIALVMRMLNFVGAVVIVYLTNPDSIEDNFRVQHIVNTVTKVGGLRDGEASEDSTDQAIKLPTTTETVQQ